MSIELTLSSGETVKVYPVSPFTLAMAGATVPMPDAPMLTLHVGPADGGHDEQHPDTDPESPAYQAYLKDKREAERARNKAANDASLLFGLRDVKPPDDGEWMAELAFVGITVGVDPLARKLAYIKHVVFQTDEDSAQVYEAVANLSYAGAVKAASLERSFRGTNNYPGDGAPGRGSADEAPGAGGNGAGQSG